MFLQGDGNATDTLNDRSKATGPDELQFPDQLPAQYQEMMRTWLVHRGSCSVEYVWSDLGKSFWPRWIKKGRCGRTDTMSCSWPPGMSCVPSSIRVLNLLRWHCWQVVIHPIYRVGKVQRNHFQTVVELLLLTELL